ncbi:MAG: T9SS type A sorting domain-containing protein, partial [candidate division KSB1 bacterium]
LTNYPATIPAGTSADYPAGSGDVMYDNNGNVHLFWETYTALPDSAGTGLDFFESTTAGIYHWSEAAGVSEIADFLDLAGGAQDSTVFAVAGAFDQHNIDGNVVCQPQGGIDAAGNLYVLFAAFRPNDVDGDGLHFTDIYAAGSNDGGKTWGEPVNVTDTPQSEDTWASLAKNIGTNLQFVYSSAGVTGNSIQGGGTAPTTYLYHSFPKANIPFGGSSVNDRPDAKVPAAFALHAAYPNPFNPSTKISFDLTKSVQVKLSVYDVNGKLLATLVNNKLEAGAHSVTWNAKGQTSGVYFAKLEAEGLSQVQKMTLVK